MCSILGDMNFLSDPSGKRKERELQQINYLSKYTDVLKSQILWHLQTLNCYMSSMSSERAVWFKERCVIPPSCGNTWILKNAHACESVLYLFLHDVISIYNILCINVLFMKEIA